MDESLLPVADELSKVPAIPGPDEQAPKAIPLRATRTDGRAAHMQQETAFASCASAPLRWGSGRAILTGHGWSEQCPED